MLEETLLIAEQAMHIALQLGRMGALHEAQLPVVNHLTAWENIYIRFVYNGYIEVHTIKECSGFKLRPLNEFFSTYGGRGTILSLP